jgi:hypothetical protein
VIWSPVRTLRRVAEEGRAFPGFLVVAIVAAVGLVTSLVFVLSGITRRQLEQPFEQQPTPGLPPGFLETFVRTFEVGAPILALITPFVGWFVVSLLMQVVTRFFNGAGPFSAMLGVVGVAQIPTLVGGAPISVLLTTIQTALGPQNTAGVLLGYLASLFGVVFFAWYVVLVVIGAAQARNIGYGESAGSCAISCVGIGVLLLAAGVILGIGIAVAVGAASR